MSDWQQKLGDDDRFEEQNDIDEEEADPDRGPIVSVLERNGSLCYVRFEDGSHEWVDYRDVEGWGT